MSLCTLSCHQPHLPLPDLLALQTGMATAAVHYVACVTVSLQYGLAWSTYRDANIYQQATAVQVDKGQTAAEASGTLLSDKARMSAARATAACCRALQQLHTTHLMGTVLQNTSSSKAGHNGQ